VKLRDLSYLVALAKTEHFGKAAELSHVSQPTLSVQLKKLEDRLGVILVERDNKNVRLTPAGKVIAEKATLVLREIEGIQTYAATQKDPLAGDLQLGIIPTLGPYLLPKIIPYLHQQLPKLSLWLHEEQTQALIERLHAGDLDAAILSPPIVDDNLIVLPLFHEPFVFAVNCGNPLAKKKNVTLQDIEQEKILLLADGHCFREQALSLCQRVHIEPHNFRATSLETLRHMVMENLGSTLFPALAAQNPTQNIVYLPFKNPSPSRELALVFRKTHVRGDLFTHMAQLISKTINIH
jgi:LysR family hydrogen peroxide-inducible transcriptional activator